MTELENTGQRAIAQQNGTKDAFEQSEMEDAFGKTLDPTAGSPATGKSMARIVNLRVDDLFGTGGNEPSCFKRLEQSYLCREFVGHNIPKTGRILKSVKTRPLMSWKKFEWNETRRKTFIALLFSAHNVQKPTRTDKLATE